MRQPLLDANAYLHFACAGAGVSFIDRLWSIPGSSAYLDGASLLQSRAAVDRFAGAPAEGSYCSKEVAFDLAIAAYLRAAQGIADSGEDAQPNQNILGMGLSASVATNRLPRGEQRAHIALLGSQGCAYRKISLPKQEGEPARREHDATIATACQELLLQHVADPQQKEADYARQRVERLPVFFPDGQRRRPDRSLKLLFPANFNPIHDGHRLACRQAEKKASHRAHFMIELAPPNKPPIPMTDALARVAQLMAESRSQQVLDRAVVLTFGLPNYLDKARAFPQSAFIAGADAAQRLFDPSWGYPVKEMMDEFKELGTEFYVMGRHTDDTFLSLSDLPVPPDCQTIFHHLEGSHPASSSQLRQDG